MLDENYGVAVTFDEDDEEVCYLNFLFRNLECIDEPFMSSQNYKLFAIL